MALVLALGLDILLPLLKSRWNRQPALQPRAREARWDLEDDERSDNQFE